VTGKTTSSVRPEGPGPKRHPLSHLEAARAALRERFRLPKPPQAGGPGRRRGAPSHPPPPRGCAAAHSVEAQAAGGREEGKGELNNGRGLLSP